MFDGSDGRGGSGAAMFTGRPGDRRVPRRSAPRRAPCVRAAGLLGVRAAGRRVGVRAGGLLRVRAAGLRSPLGFVVAFGQ
jgi:hypothetical protein